MTAPVAGAHYPRSTGEFLSWFGTDDDCLDYLEWLRWPGGFVCPDCGNAGGWRLGDGRVKCGDCGSRTSVTAGTIFDKTRTPLTVWFHACWLFATAKDGISAQHLQRVLEISSYQTAWAMLHRLRSALVRPGRDRLSGTVEVDETCIGGEEPGLRGGRQRGKKVLTGIAVEVREPKGIGRCRMAPLDDASGDTLGTFVTENVQPGATVITDGWAAYRVISGKGYQHRPVSQKAARAAGEDPDSLLPGVHRVASLCKRWLLGTHQGSVDAAHLPAYLNEFVFRFNRRRSASRGMVFYRVLQLAAGHEPVRYVDLLASKKPRRAKRAEGGTGHPPSLERPAADRPWRTAGIQLQFPVRLSGYPGRGFITGSCSYAFWSRSPDPPHLAVLARPGFVSAASRPPRHLPDQAALSFHQAAATAQREGLPPPSTLSASRRTSASWRTEQPVPRGVIPGEPGGLQRQDDPDLAEGDLGDHALESGPLPGHRPGDAQVAVDDPDRLPRPAQLPGPVHQVILAGGGLGIAFKLGQGGLADIYYGRSGEVGAGYLAGLTHRPPPPPLRPWRSGPPAA